MPQREDLQQASEAEAAGRSLLQSRRFEPAAAEFQRALSLNPASRTAPVGLVRARMQRAEQLQLQGRREEAIAQLRLATQFAPSVPEPHAQLGQLLRLAGELPQAAQSLQRALELRPDFPQALTAMGNVHLAQARAGEAIALFTRAIQLSPEFPDAYINLATALRAAGQPQRAVAAAEQALRLRPDHPPALLALAQALQDHRRLDDAISTYRRALALEPNLVPALRGLANALREIGDCPGALAMFDRAVALSPDDPPLQSERLFALHYDPNLDMSGLAAEHRRWNDRFAAHFSPATRDNDSRRASAGARLRVGYVSQEFFNSVTAANFLPVLQRHDRKRLEIFCYAASTRQDGLTERLKSEADHWRWIAGLDDASAADLIRADRIDILVDLSLHTPGNRLLVFARRPAPVQITWLAYPGTSGMAAMDLRLSDPILDPDDAALAEYSERTIRFPRSYWCYQPHPTAPPPAATMPAATMPDATMPDGPITFGCLNNPAKLSQPALDCWAKILAELPAARLLLHTHAPEQTSRAVLRAGIDPRRIELVGRQSEGDYFQTFSRIHLSLDPFPFSGGITTLDSLYLGTPVLTLFGNTPVGRSSASILQNCGLGEMICRSRQDYIARAISLARDPGELLRLRRRASEGLRSSGLMDVDGFTRDLESIYLGLAP